MKDMNKKPNYYLLPNGIEVGDVTDYLTSNGGQAVQYIARSCRLDGQHKGERIEDLKKAKDMIDREIKRLLLESGGSEGEQSKEKRGQSNTRDSRDTPPKILWSSWKIED